MEPRKNIGFIIVAIIICLFVFYKCRSTYHPNPITPTDSIRSINDTLIFQLDSIDSLLIRQKVQYEEDINTILHQSIDSDILYFSKYLSIERFNGSYFSQPTEAN